MVVSSRPPAQPAPAHPPPPPHQVGDPGAAAELLAEVRRRQGGASAGEPQPLRPDGAVAHLHAGHRHVRPGHQQGHQRDRRHQRLLHLHLPR